MTKAPWVETVAPNKATFETFYVCVAALAVVFFSAVIIHFNQRSHTDAATLQPFEISVRYDLTPAEQGIFADLLLVYEDWLQQNPADPNPTLAMLLADNWPPFTDRAEQKNRGAHRWQKIRLNGQDAYLGQSQNRQLAGHFLWILPPSRQNATLNDLAIWLNKSPPVPALTDLTPASLIAAGWKKINRQNEIKR